MQESIIRIENLFKKYGDKVALNNISLTIKKGSVYGLIGQNGAGKTTLIRILNQIINADRGTILFKEQPITLANIKDIGYLPEERGLYKNMTIEEQALYFGQLKSMTKLKAKEQLNYWLQRFDILDWKKKKIQDLSKGMAQKVQFIITVLHQPEFLILDEPFSGFDPINTQLISDEIKHLAKQGTTIIFSSHRMESIEEMCDALCFIHKGTILLEGSIKEIQQNYAKEIFEIQLKNFNKEKLDLFLSKKEYRISIIEKNEVNVLLEVSKTNLVSNLLDDVLTIGELSLYKQHIPSLQEVFVKTIENA